MLCQVSERGFWLETLQWRYSERHSVSNHRRLTCLLNRMFRRRSLLHFGGVFANSMLGMPCGFKRHGYSFWCLCPRNIFLFTFLLDSVSKNISCENGGQLHFFYQCITIGINLKNCTISQTLIPKMIWRWNTIGRTMVNKLIVSCTWHWRML